MVEDRACRKILLMGCDDDPEDHPAPGGPDDEAEAPLPFDLAEVNGEFRAIAEEECARLRPLLARHEEEERDNRDDLPRRVSFDDSAEGERVHRYQTHWSRSLLRTLAALRNHREDEAGADPEPGPSPPSPALELPTREAEAPEPPPVAQPSAEVPPSPTTSDVILRNKANAEEATSKESRGCVESRGENEATPTAASCRRHHVPFLQPGSLCRSRCA